ncbi:MAG TPA: isochorismatase family protein [Candidatus Acidoferrales bacterium]|nr:isochorismatase family protein [Candidatus Dormibacteraeota bacterium]HEX2715197.1 isochorismatase family protein [Candidatus Acidoferrales bacterium]
MTAFKIEDTALILIDHQVGVSSWISSIDPNEMKRNAAFLAKFAKSQGIPVVLTSSLESQYQGAILPELQEAVPDAYEDRVQRSGTINAWDDPAFVAACRATGRRNFVLAGITTDVCAAPAAIGAAADGFNVKVAVDACGSRSKLADEAAFGTLAAAGISLMSSSAILTELAKDWASPAGRALQRMFAGD